MTAESSVAEASLGRRNAPAIGGQDALELADTVAAGERRPCHQSKRV
jgi:hypothetical protein